MFKLSEIVREISDVKDVEFQNEKEFCFFALSASEVDKPFCVFVENEKYLGSLSPNVVMIITTENLKEKALSKGIGVCVTENPKLLFFACHNYLTKKEGYKRMDFETVIGKNCTISPLCYISPKNVRIGDNVVIEEFATIKENTVIGDNSVICSGCVISGNGYEFKRNGNSVLGVAHIGGVVIGKNVELQSNTCIDRAVYPWDDTVIGDYTTMDDLIQIAHGAKIGKRVMITAGVTVAGRTVIGDDVWIGPNSSLINGIKIGNNARINVGSIVTKSVRDGESVTGNFAISHERFLEHLKKIR